MKHKTVASKGPAIIIISQDIESLMLKFDVIRSEMEPQSQELSRRLFLTYTGNEFRKISETIVEVTQQYGLPVPTAGLHQIVVVTEGQESLGNKHNRILHHYMAHNAKTARRFYNHPGSKNAVKAYNTINKLMKKKHFTIEDEKLLTEWPLDKERTQTLKLCSLIVKRHKLNRNKKQLQDHWIHIFKKASIK